MLETASKLSDKIAIGLTTDNLLKKKKYFEQIESYETRDQNLRNFLKAELGLEDINLEILPLKDFSGPAVNSTSIDALICSKETYQNAERINSLRIKRGVRPLVLVVIPIVTDSEGDKISSTKIRSKSSQLA